ncbi:MAG: DUF4129 domain-containing protein [Ilumatobacter sp.]|nr:DUF4129 domain-containing protein [Ilumatobacter sp.]
MTITEARPAPRAARDWQPGTPAQRARPAAPAAPVIDPQLSGELLAVAALALFSITVAAGYTRVFAGWQFLDDFIVLAVVGHGLGFVLRRLRVPGVLAVPVLAAALVWLIGYVFYRDSYSWLLPTNETLTLFQAEIDLVQQQFRGAVAPVIYGGGWDVLAAIGIGLTVVLSDTFAFRAFARAEALVPGGVLFVFIAALGYERSRIALTMLLIAAGVITTVALRAYHAPHRSSAIGRRRSPSAMILPAALGTAALVAVTAGVFGPRLPGADSEPIYETRGGDSGRVTNVVSPLVDIRSRLTNRSNSELFVVEADFESYWRLSALPRFDGTRWGLPERALTRADGELSTARSGATELRQTIRISNLGDKFVPTAADPIAASPQDGLRWNADSATLLKLDGELAPGDTYEIVSASPRFDLDALRAAGSTGVGDPIYLELPDDFPSSVGEIARQVTAGAATPYDVALTLQTWFRSEFDYSLEVQAGHGTNAIEGFLRDRVGYCEQFAGTYAAMMRTLGIPARVAVGFTPGTFDGTGYSVLGKNAHAWPEVWFSGLGWVPFEPTPGRGAPGAENYTNVPPEQDVSGVDPDAPRQQPADPDDINTPAPTTTVASSDDPDDPDAPAIPAGVDQTLGPTDDAAPPPEPPSFPWAIVVAIIAAIVLLLAPALIRRFRRHHEATDDAGAIALLWRRATDALGEVGVRTKSSLTPEEHAVAAAAKFPIAARPMRSLAEALTTVTFAPGPGVAATYFPDFDQPDRHAASRVADCELWCRQIERAVNESISPLVRVRRYFTRLG